MAEHLTIPGALEWDAVERHSIASLRYAGGKEHDVKYVSEVAYDALKAELKASREALDKFKTGCVDLSSQVRELEHKMDYYKGEGRRGDALQRRLAVAEQFVQRLVDCSKGNDSIATSYLADILATFKPAKERL